MPINFKQQVPPYHMGEAKHLSGTLHLGSQTINLATEVDKVVFNQPSHGISNEIVWLKNPPYLSIYAGFMITQMDATVIECYLDGYVICNRGALPQKVKVKASVGSTRTTEVGAKGDSQIPFTVDFIGGPSDVPFKSKIQVYYDEELVYERDIGELYPDEPTPTVDDTVDVKWITPPGTHYTGPIMLTCKYERFDATGEGTLWIRKFVGWFSFADLTPHVPQNQQLIKVKTRGKGLSTPIIDYDNGYIEYSYEEGKLYTPHTVEFYIKTSNGETKIGEFKIPESQMTTNFLGYDTMIDMYIE